MVRQLGLPVILLAFVLLLMMAVTALSGLPALTNITRNQGHADARHVDEAPQVRRLYQDGLCEGTELWFSPPLGTVLILCGIPEIPMWGGLIYRVVENNGQFVLDASQAYECTVFIADRPYWDRTIGLGGYLPLGQFPDLERKLRDMWGTLG